MELLVDPDRDAMTVISTMWEGLKSRRGPPDWPRRCKRVGRRVTPPPPRRARSRRAAWTALVRFMKLLDSPESFCRYLSQVQTCWLTPRRLLAQLDPAAPRTGWLREPSTHTSSSYDSIPSLPTLPAPPPSPTPSCRNLATGGPSWIKYSSPTAHRHKISTQAVAHSTFYLYACAAFCSW